MEGREDMWAGFMLYTSTAAAHRDTARLCGMGSAGGTEVLLWLPRVADRESTETHGVLGGRPSAGTPYRDWNSYRNPPQF